MTNIIIKSIIEIAGFPKEHVEKTMQQVIDKLKDSKDWEILEQNLEPTQEIKGIWSSFIEVKISFKDLNKMVEFAFTFLPSSIEVLEPGDVKLTQKDLTLWFSDILTALHKYDLALKKLIAENRVLKNRLGE